VTAGDALREQLAHRAELLRAGAAHVGWKLGMGDRERLDGSIAVGHLTTATLHDAVVPVDPDGDLHADVEIAVELRAPIDPLGDVMAARAAIGGYATALEIVDLAPVLDTAVAVVATNVFHRAVAFGPVRPALPAGELRCAARVDGEVRATAAAQTDLAERLRAAARLLATAGLGLAAGDRVITGSIVQIPVEAGAEVVGELDGLGAVRLSLR
jgi:2-keto-4-pentenoate hydratase